MSSSMSTAMPTAMPTAEYTKLYVECNKQLRKHNQQLAYRESDLSLLVNLFDTYEYINKCVYCHEDIGQPRQLCGKTICYSGPFQLDDDHYEYYESVEDILDKYVCLIRLIHPTHLDTNVDEQLTVLK